MKLKDIVKPVAAAANPGTYAAAMIGSKYANRNKGSGYGGGNYPSMNLDKLFGDKTDLTKRSTDILSRREKALEGLSSDENKALRDKAMAGIQGQTKANLKQTQAIQGKQGLKGGMASAQQIGVLNEGQQAKAGVEQDLMLANIAQKQNALNAYSEEVGARQYGIVSSLLGERQLDVAQSTGQAAAAAAGKRGLMSELTVICTELYVQGYLPKDVLRADREFGKLIRKWDPVVFEGYLTWARPVVYLMTKSKIFSWLMSLIFVPWANDMAFQMGMDGKRSKFGEMVMRVGYPFSKMVGRVKSFFKGECHAQ